MSPVRPGAAAGWPRQSPAQNALSGILGHQRNAGRRGFGVQRGQVSRARPVRRFLQARQSRSPGPGPRASCGECARRERGFTALAAAAALAEDLRIRAAQVVAVEQRQVNKLPGHARRAEFERIGGSGRGVLTNSAAGHADAQQRAAASSQTANRAPAGSMAASSCRSGQHFPCFPGRPPSSRRKTSWRCASRAAEGTPAFAASTSSRETATTGIRAASARPFTAASPTRTPVKLPGPFTATMAPDSSTRRRSVRQQFAHGRHQRGRIAAPFELDLAEDLDRLLPASRPSATEPEGPQVSMASRSVDSA
jgi:hypothetical protein